MAYHGLAIPMVIFLVFALSLIMIGVYKLIIRLMKLALLFLGMPRLIICLMKTTNI
nr:MAG TPA: Photosystem II protein D1 1, ELECTRON TRANSPORT [Caudoviricetes sp.]